ncbi:Membrane protein [Sulfitobacter guttiformis KCTC 32187]|nr:Membrane protein [Sulfitobacter guttiformis KCTC 32187]
MEYVGDPLEKLLGFFIAVVILTFYIGIVNLLLMFVSFSFFQSSFVGYLASVIGVIPIWFYAQYRARRYVLARTRWRGVRFGLEKGAWGYAWRALAHWLITICTAGILWPRMTFWLEKYKTDRTYFGSTKLVQGGRWQMLFPAAMPFAASVLALGVLGVWLVYITPLIHHDTQSMGELIEGLRNSLDAPEDFVPAQFHMGWRLYALIPIMLLMIYGLVHYRFVSKRILANHKHAEGVQMASKLNGMRISLIYVLGTTIAYTILLFGLLAIVGVAIGLMGPEAFFEDQMGIADPMADLPRWMSLAIVAVLYLSVFLFWSVLHHAFVTYPLMRHMAVSLSLVNIAGLAQVSQRARDEFAEAEGFAEALDLGAAI